jgi:hypothetical protein
MNEPSYSIYTMDSVNYAAETYRNNIYYLTIGLIYN